MSNTTQSKAANRIEALLDANSFVEIGAKVTARSTDFNLTEKKAASDGVVTGYGVIDNRPVYVYSQDASVLGGSMGEMHARKITALYDIAIKTGVPVIGLVDCAGLRLEEATDALEAFGAIYLKQTLASGVIPQITAVFGTCGGGMALVPALSDFTFVEKERGHIFVNSPNALEGNRTEKCDSSSAEFQSKETGMVDGIGTEEEILDQIRTLVTLLPSSNWDNDTIVECSDSLNRLLEGAGDYAQDAGMLLSALADDEAFFEIKPEYGKDIAAGFIRLNGLTVGAVANRSVIYGEDGNKAEELGTTLSSRGARKAASLVRFCDAFGIPVLTLTNVTGFSASLCNEKMLARSVGSMVAAFAEASVPKVNVITGKAYGSAYTAMNSKSLGADFVFAWEDAEIGMMDASLAAKILSPGASAADLAEKADAYRRLQSNVESAAARGYVDTVIAAAETRKYVITAFDILYAKKEVRPDKKHGTV
ncbi:MAG: carboxyl transferase [Blautia sp.]|nr:carboxyl transferase [Blautia sp.]